MSDLNVYSPLSKPSEFVQWAQLVGVAFLFNDKYFDGQSFARPVSGEFAFEVDLPDGVEVAKFSLKSEGWSGWKAAILSGGVEVAVDQGPVEGLPSAEIAEWALGVCLERIAGEFEPEGEQEEEGEEEEDDDELKCRYCGKACEDSSGVCDACYRKDVRYNGLC